MGNRIISTLFVVVLLGVIFFFGGCQFGNSNDSADLNDSTAEAIEHPVFDQHIEPIIVQNCSPCHRENGGAPFVFKSYEQIKKKQKTFLKVVVDRIMPPWPADVHYSSFIEEKRLSNAQIKTIQNWVKDGCPSGANPNQLLAQVQPFESSLGKPDLVLYLDSVSLPQGSDDRFFLMTAPGLLPQKKYIKAVELIPGQPNLMHHFNGHWINYEFDSRKNFSLQPRKVELTPGKGDRSTSTLDLLTDNGQIPERKHSVVNYLPGVFGVMYPDGIGTFEAERKFIIVGNDVHYGPSRKSVVDRSRINIFFTDVPPKRGTGELMLGTNGVSKIVPPLVIPPNKITKHTTSFEVPADISILTLNPHLHLLGKSFKAYAVKPNGDTINLIWIPKWDFRWQYFYTFKKMVKVPRGSIITAEAVFDNTTANPNNPNRPPKTVSERMDYFGSSMKASDEMFQFIITYLGYEPGDENRSLEFKMK